MRPLSKIFIALLLVTAPTLSFGLGEQILGTAASNVVVTAEDVARATSMMAPKDRQMYLANESLVTSLVKRIAAAKEREYLVSQLSAEERKTLALDAALAAQTYAQKILVERAISKMATQDQIRQRAREIHLRGHPACTKPATYASSHILIRTDNRTLKQAVELVWRLSERIKRGEKFETLARKYSEDPSSAKEGGKLPIFSRAELDPVYAREYFSVNRAGKISDPVQTRYGIHIIRNDGQVSPAAKLDFEACEQTLVEMAEKELRDVAVRSAEREVEQSISLQLRSSELAAFSESNKTEAPNASERVKEALRKREGHSPRQNKP